MEKKMFFCVIVRITLTLMFSSIVFASDASSVIGGLNNASSDVGVLAGPATAIIGLIKYIAIAVAFGMIIIIGIKWMTAGAGGKAGRFSEAAGQTDKGGGIPHERLPLRAPSKAAQLHKALALGAQKPGSV